MTRRRRSSQSVERRLAELETATASGDPDTEWFFSPGYGMMHGEGISTGFASQGFVVTRQIYDEVANLSVTPAVGDATRPLSWTNPPPTAAVGDVRLVWDTPEALAAAVEDAEAPPATDQTNRVEVVEPSDALLASEGAPTDEVIDVAEYDEYRCKAVLPVDRAIKATVVKRSAAERRGYDVAAPVEQPVVGNADLDLVRVRGDAPAWSERDSFASMDGSTP